MLARTYARADARTHAQTHANACTHTHIHSHLQDMLNTLSKGSPEEDLEIRDIDDTTTTGDILAALQKVAGNDFCITSEAIKIRKGFRGTQTASVTLVAATAQKVVGEYSKIRIG
ncbi:hypothetical protein EVAR_35870_1 [Eumeta japonica]|uniref:Uncharacterized protein n=1 Tax=Eumeta variegata TaxID=151549 RepID=A0A4C1WWR3_EUMVA|nr:hypothetical protein EVAR_35870_1 [Eumeta japonica]